MAMLDCFSGYHQI
jgi:hypothetical protein